ncbi:MAG: fumarylacetoacetase, partial [Croceibacterium sp.]
MISTDETHDPHATSWVNGADGHPEFPVQNLPLGVFSPPGGGKRGGVAIGDFVLDLAAVAGLLE